jgi:hypothetical protein
MVHVVHVRTRDRYAVTDGWSRELAVITRHELDD